MKKYTSTVEAAPYFEGDEVALLAWLLDHGVLFETAHRAFCEASPGDWITLDKKTNLVAVRTQATFLSVYRPDLD